MIEYVAVSVSTSKAHLIFLKMARIQELLLLVP
uniref:Uncharacterized protein n=1 Tax=Siphoviridae sp. ctDhw1 TaxID=2827813 RepID=A0A8S5SJV6_9CAUD|nr:MAG TPA: hypothetical protein [Siphoviridae sp. ctDhw1]